MIHKITSLYRLPWNSVFECFNSLVFVLARIIEMCSFQERRVRVSNKRLCENTCNKFTASSCNDDDV